VLLLALLAAVVACPARAPQAGDLAGKNAVMIIAHRNFRDEELMEPKAALEAKGVKVTVACSRLAKAEGMLGAAVTPDVLLKDVKAADYDAVIFVGGPGASEYFDDATAHKIAQDAVAQGKVLGAICIAPATLANAGVLRGKNATCYSSQSRALEKNGAMYTRAPVQRDGKIITAEGPSAAGKFGEAIIEALGE
jgi:protease I